MLRNSRVKYYTINGLQIKQYITLETLSDFCILWKPHEILYIFLLKNSMSRL